MVGTKNPVKSACALETLVQQLETILGNCGKTKRSV
jgi:hypothetical protein